MQDDRRDLTEELMKEAVVQRILSVALLALRATLGREATR